MAGNTVSEQVIKKYAEELGRCRDESEGKAALARAANELKTAEDWSRLKKAYALAPRLILKEATAAAALNALSAYVDKILAQRASGK